MYEKLVEKCAPVALVIAFVASFFVGFEWPREWLAAGAFVVFGTAILSYVFAAIAFVVLDIRDARRR